jgi:aspartate 4-decarboxylase
MDYANLARLANLSPFELKDTLIQLASSHAERTMLNAGRGNPNWLATIPRHGFFTLGQFAMEEAERSYGYLRQGVGGLPERAGMEARFEVFLARHAGSTGAAFLKAALSYARDALGLPADGVLFEMVESILGCQYPVPPRMLHHSEAIVRQYLLKEMAAGRAISSKVDLFATEGGAAAITYVFNTLRENRLIAPGDSIALGMPIFTPYIEIPQLGDYQLVEILLEADEQNRWQYPDREIDKLLDPKVKAFFLVNPGNPTSVKISDDRLARIARLVAERRPDLIILTDDVYATFADDFVSLFTTCPHNTILAYSYSKYFGATGWRLGVIALHEDNVLDQRLAALPRSDLAALDDRYKSLVAEPRKLKFIDRLVADSRAVGLNHVAGLSCPQQVQMTLFSLFALIDERDEYKAEMKHIIRQRYHNLYRHVGVDRGDDVNAVDYYTLIDLEALGDQRHGRAFADWLLANKEPTEPLARLADEGGLVLLPGQGFGALHPSARVSLANLRDADYARIGDVVSAILDKYYQEFTQVGGNMTQQEQPKNQRTHRHQLDPR